MSATASINTTTGNHPLDPYKTQNFEDPPLAQKIEDLVDFISEVKFGMLTTKQSNGELLISRCMALAAKVSKTPKSCTALRSISSGEFQTVTKKDNC